MKSVAKRNFLVIGTGWLVWAGLVAIEVLARPFDWLQPLFFVTVLGFLLGSVWANANVFPAIQSSPARILASGAVAVLIALIAGYVGILLAVNIKLTLGGHL